MKLIGQLRAILSLDKTKYDQGLNQAEKKASGLGTAFKKIGGYIAAAFSIGIIKNFTEHIIGLASQTEGVRIAFERLNNPGLLTSLRAATRNTVTDLQLMQKTIQAQNFKIPLSQLTTYFEFATKRAIQTGESVDYLVDSIITGIGRKSVLVMDNLGISAIELQEEVTKVGDFGIASGNIIRRELESMGDVADTTAIKVASISTALENLKTGLGTRITESTFFQGFTTWLSNIGKFAQVPGVSLLNAIYGATIKPKEFNQILDESNKKIIENANAIQKQKDAIAASQRAVITRVKAPGRPITPAMPTGIPLPATPGLAGAPNVTKQQAEDLTRALQIQNEAVGILANSFNALFEGGEDGFRNMIDSMISSFKRLVAEMAAKAAILGLISLIFPGTAFGASALTGLRTMFTIPGGASGGTVPPGYPHDTFPAMLSSGETILTARQSRELNKMINVHVSGEIAGNVINLAQRRSQYES